MKIVTRLFALAAALLLALPAPSSAQAPGMLRSGSNALLPDALTNLLGYSGSVPASALTITGLTLSAPVLSGTVTGTYTLGGTPTLGAALALPGSGQITAAGWLGLGDAPAAQFHVQGTISAPAWTTNGIRIRVSSGTLTDTTSSGTVAATNINVFGTPTLAASSATTYTEAVNVSIGGAPIAGSNVTITKGLSVTIGGNTEITGSNAAASTDATPNGVLRIGLAGSTVALTVGGLGGSHTWLQSRQTTAANWFGLYLNPSGGNVSIGGGTAVPQALLHVGKTAGTVRSYNSFTSASVGEYCFGAGDWGKTANTCTFGTESNGGATERPVSIVAAGALALHITTAANVVLGSTLASPAGIAATRLGIHGVDYGSSAFAQTRWGTTNAGPFYALGRSRGTTIGDYTAVASDDLLGSVTFMGTDGDSFAGAASITARATGTVSDGIVPGLLDFGTATAAGAITRAMRIGPTQLIAFGPGAALTASFPAWKRNGTAAEIWLADGSAYAPFAASAYSAGATPGVSCSGAPTAGFASVNGIVTAC
jgi:hypothetical protein